MTEALELTQVVGMGEKSQITKSPMNNNVDDLAKASAEDIEVANFLENHQKMDC